MNAIWIEILEKIKSTQLMVTSESFIFIKNFLLSKSAIVDYSKITNEQSELFSGEKLYILVIGLSRTSIGN